MSRTSLGLAALIALAACGGGSPSGEGGGGATTSTTSTSSATGSGGAAPIASCGEISAAGCFSNLDCASASDRCENRGTEADPVACCVPGARGTGKGGDPCKVEGDCETAICVIGSGDTGTCSPACTGDQDCPAALPSCYSVDPSKWTGSFCFPF